METSTTPAKHTQNKTDRSGYEQRSGLSYAIAANYVADRRFPTTLERSHELAMPKVMQPI